jgi:hypothetical protein
MAAAGPVPKGTKVPPSVSLLIEEIRISGNGLVDP